MIRRVISAYIMIGLAIGMIAPVQAQIIAVEKTKHDANWVQRKITEEATQFSQWGRRRIANVLQRFVKPTEKEQAVIEKWIKGDSLNRIESLIWRHFKKRVIVSRGSLATIVGVIAVIVAGTKYYKKQQEIRKKQELAATTIKAAFRDYHIKKQALHGVQQERAEREGLEAAGLLREARKNQDLCRCTALFDLIDAVWDNDLEKVNRLLLTRGVNVNYISYSGASTVLMEAIKRSRASDVAIVDRLLEAGADVNASKDRLWDRVLQREIDCSGDTALRMAILGGKVAIIERLLKAGVDVDASVDEPYKQIYADGEMLPWWYYQLLQAIENRNVSIIRGLLAVGIHIKPIFPHFTRGYIDENRSFLKVLVDMGLAAVNAQDLHGYTALMYYIEDSPFMYKEMIKLLLAAGADVSIKNNAGKTAYDLARAQEIRNMLKRARLWQVQKELEVGRLKPQPEGDTSPFEMLPAEMIHEIMRRVKDAEFPEKEEELVAFSHFSIS